MRNRFNRVALIYPNHCFGIAGDVILPHPTSLEYLASSIQDAVESVIMIDENCGGVDFGELGSYAPDLVGISMHSYQYRDVVALASEIKERVSSHPRIAVGGLHPSLEPEESMSNECIDYVIRGEGELVLRELVSGVDQEEILGLSYRKDENIIHNPSKPLLTDLDRLPFPARELRRHPEKYTIFGLPYASLMTSRGCPNDCAFCNAHNIHEGVWRSRSIESIIREIEHIESTVKPRVYFFWDLDFFVDRERLVEFCREIKARGIEIDFVCMGSVKAILGCRDILPELRECGLRIVQVGLERPDDESLQELNKDITVSQSVECIDALRTSDVYSVAFFIVGLPEDEETLFDECMDYAESIHLDMLFFVDPLPLPRTPFREELAKGGHLRDESWDNLSFYTYRNLRLENMTQERYEALMNRYRFKYFLKPRNLLRFLTLTRDILKPSLTEALRILSFTRLLFR